MFKLLHYAYLYFYTREIITQENTYRGCFYDFKNLKESSVEFTDGLIFVDSYRISTHQIITDKTYFDITRFFVFILVMIGLILLLVQLF